MPVPPESAFASVRALGRDLRAGKFTSVELTGFFLDRCEKYGPRFNAVTTVLREGALEQARRADAELRAGTDRGPLHGIPCGVKDLLAARGAPTTWGAAPFQEQTFERDATVVIALRRAGAVLAAKLGMVELAGGLGYRQANASFTGPGLNPWDATRWAGGSSSGPGSAIAAGLVPFSIGSETWGSIVTPSGYCGISGLRPTYGRVSRHGAMALSWTMDKIGPMCRTAQDCGLVLAAIAGPDPSDPTAVGLPYEYPPKEAIVPPFRIGVVKGSTLGIQDEVKANFEKSLEVLGRFAKIDTVELPDHPYNSIAGTIISCEAASIFEDLVHTGDVWEMTAPEDRWGLHSTLVIPAVDYLRAMRLRMPAQRDLDALLAKYDVLATPTLSTVAPPADRPFREYARGFVSTQLGAAGNVAGLPGISVPNGFGEKGLPTGIQFVGRAFEENRVLAVATAYQAATDWHARHPRLDPPAPE
jgi:aspartyl-tRNA(Asn)/glutamyl-tRNA(Gln) amidotransferase subunit A